MTTSNRKHPAVRALPAVLGLFLAPLAWAQQPVSLTFTELTQIGTDIDGFVFDGPVGDFYARVTIDGTLISTESDNYDFGFDLGSGFLFPFTLRPDLQKEWQIGTIVAGAPGSVNVQIEIMDSDDVDDDDQADLNPGVARVLNLTLDLATGRWAGDVTWPQKCAQGTGGDAVRVCWEISLLSTTGDADGDGLYDFWELNGQDVDGDGTVDVDLPAFGADPLHKDLFLELDWMNLNGPSRADIQAMKLAFANAPANAGIGASSLGGRDAQTNPDGLPGINLWVDTGNLGDPGAREDGAGLTTCGDGIDNGLDGVADSLDSDCLAGDDLGGGNQVGLQAIPALDTTFYAVKAANFSAMRRWAFRYGLSATPGFEDGSPAGDSCFDGVDNGGGDEDGDGNAEIDGFDSDCWPWGGGWGEVGGNDFIEYNHDGGTVMHELGHTLNLRHGGNEDANCKPNYVSVMNYDNQFGIQQVGGGSIFDYSPPRIQNEDKSGAGSCFDGFDNGFDGVTDSADPDCGSRGAIPPLVIENNLSEFMVLDATDVANRFVYKNSNSVAIQSPLDGDVDQDGPGDGDGDGLGDGVNWNSDGDTNDVGLTVNVDSVDNNGTPGTLSDDRPISCRNGVTDSSLAGFDDWTNVAISFRHFGDAADGAINPVPDAEIARPELRRLQESLNTTDLAMAKTAEPLPVEAGRDLTYTLRVENRGPNPAMVRLEDALPDGVQYRSDDAGCLLGADDVLTCSLAEIAAGAQREVRITVGTQEVCEGGMPRFLANSATVENASEAAGADPSPADNSALAGVLPVDTTLPSLEISVAPEVLWPPNHKLVSVRTTLTATDSCDDMPEVRLLSIVSNQPDNDGGDGNTDDDVQGAAYGTDDREFRLRSERSGGGARTYTISYEIEDGSGNRAVQSVIVSVPADGN